MDIIRKLFAKKNSKTVVNALALLLVVSTVNAPCYWMMYQPDVPKAAEKYKKL